VDWEAIFVDAVNLTAVRDFMYTRKRFGTTSIVQLLLHHGAIPTIFKTDGDTLLNVLVSDRTVATVGIFWMQGRTPKRQTSVVKRRSITPRGTLESSPLKSCWNFDSIDYEGRTPLQAFFSGRQNTSTFAACHIRHHETFPEVRA
jgi:hypothetical protein